MFLHTLQQRRQLPSGQEPASGLWDRWGSAGLHACCSGSVINSLGNSCLKIPASSPLAGHQGSFCMLCVMQNHIVQAFGNSGNAIKPVSFIRDLKSKSPPLPGGPAQLARHPGCGGAGRGWGRVRREVSGVLSLCAYGGAD